MKEYKVGDKVVRSVQSSSSELYGIVGHIYTVSRVHVNNNRCCYFRIAELPSSSINSNKFMFFSRPCLLPDELFEL